MVPTGDGVFSAPNGELTYTVDTRTSDGTVWITDSDGGRSKPRTWERQPPFVPTPQQLAAYAGDYICEELGGLVYSVYVERDTLRARARPVQRITLVPVFPDGFAGGNNTFRFTRNTDGQVEGFRVYAGRVRNLRFARRQPTQPAG